jgi:glycosyltransferase involved in cell wall biosynthesis
VLPLANAVEHEVDAMNIAVVLDRFDPDLGGLERWGYQLVKWLVGEGHNVHVVAMEFAEHGLALDISRHRFQASASWLRRAAAAERCLRSVQADVVHDLGTGWYFDVFQPQFGSRIAGWRQSVRAEPWYGRPLRVLSPGRRRSYWSRRQLEKRQLGSPRGVIVAVSRLVEFHLRHLHGVDPRRIRLVYNGVDTEHFTPARRTTDRPAIRAALGLGHEDVLCLVAAVTFWGSLMTLRSTTAQRTSICTRPSTTRAVWPFWKPGPAACR